MSQTTSDGAPGGEVARLRLLLSTVVIVASVIVIVIGLQGHQASQKADRAVAAANAQAASAKRQAQCVNDWAERFTRITRDRVEQRGRLDDAKRAHDDAVDGVLLVFVKASQHLDDQAYQRSLRDDFVRALGVYNAATTRLERVEADTRQLSDSASYPRLDC